MSKITETTLRIRAQNLASKDLRQVSTELDKLTDNQKENSTASGLAGRAIKDLKDELAALQVISRNLARRGGIAEGLKKDKIAIGETEKKIVDLRKKLEGLNAAKATGTPIKGIGEEIRKAQRSLGAMESKLEKQKAKLNESAKSAEKLGISAARTGESIKKINIEADRTAELVREAERAMEAYNGAVKEARVALNAQKAIHRDITREIEKRRDAEERGNRIAHDRARKQALDRQEQHRIGQQLVAQFSAPPRLRRGQTFGPAGDQSAVVAASTASVAAKKASEELAAATARETAFHERLNNVLRRRGGALAALATVQASATVGVKKSTEALDRNAKSLDRNNRLTGIFSDTGRKSLSVYQRLRGQILSTAAAYIGLFQAVNLVTSAVKKEQDRKRIDIQLKTANRGDAEAAARDQEFLRKEADRLGLVYEDLAKNFANYKIAAQEVGASNNTIRASFVNAAEVVTGLALSAEDADGVFRAFVQILGKARVQAEELRGQLGDRLPGAVAIFANSLVARGKIKSITELDKYLKDGKAGIAELFAFLEDFAKKTKGAVEEQSKTLFSQINRLKNAYGDFLVTFAKAGVSNELLNIVNELIAKLKGEDGGKFARDLSDAFVVVGKTILIVIDNFDTFITALKYFLGLQVAKAVVGLASGFAIFAFNVYKGLKAIVVWTAAMNAARIAGTGLTFAMRGVLALLGPIGIAIGVAATAWYAYGRAQAEAKRQSEEHLGVMNRLKTAQGDALRGEIDAGAARAQTQLKELQGVRAKLAAAKAFAKDNPNAAIQQRILKSSDKFAKSPNDVKSIENLEKRVGVLAYQLRETTFEVVSGSKRYVTQLEREREARAKDNAQVDNFAVSKSDDAAEKKAKDTSKSDAALAERRLDLADRTAKELLDIENELLEARLSAEITTQDQIDANLKSKLAVIGNEIDKKRIELEGLKRDAENAGSSEGVKNADAAIARLAALQQEQEAKTRIEATTASIELKERNINALVAARDDEITRLNTLVEVGLLSEVDARAQIVQLQLKSKDAITSAIVELQAQLQALKESQPNLAKILGVDELIAKLEITKIKAAETKTNLQLVGEKLGGQFAAGASSALRVLVEGLAGTIEGVNSIGDAFKNAGRSFALFIADFLMGIAQAILQAIILKAIMNAINGTSGGYGAAALGALTGHTGGVVRSSGIGSGNPIRQVSPAVFANAQRFHQGGLPGLRRNEVPAILQKNEEVLTQDDPRNVLNGGARGGPPVQVTALNMFDREEFAGEVLSAQAAGPLLINHVSRNKTAFKRALGIAG